MEHPLSPPRTLDPGLVGGLCILLVDFDNFLPPGQRVVSTELFSHELLAIIRHARRTAPTPANFLVRLYGGWYSDGALTAAGSQVAQIVATAALFPLIDEQGSIVRGSIEMVDELFALPGTRIGDTYRRRAGLPRLRLSTSGCPPQCAAPDACPLTALQRLTRKKTATCSLPTCAVSTAEAFVVHEQKMVDTLLACDLLEATRQGVQNVVVVTSDTDLLPAALQAGSSGANHVLVLSDQDAWRQEHLDALHRVGVATATRSDT